MEQNKINTEMKRIPNVGERVIVKKWDSHIRGRAGQEGVVIESPQQGCYCYGASIKVSFGKEANNVSWLSRSNLNLVRVPKIKVEKPKYKAVADYRKITSLPK